MTKRTLAVALLLLGALAGAAPTAATATAPCAARNVTVALTHIPGSDGAGNTVYRLTAVSRANAVCTLGRPALQLIGAGGARLQSRGVGVGPKITLARGRTAATSVRFTPDIAAEDEHHTGACEPPAHAVSVTFAGSPGRVTGPVKPPTPVCQHGAMQVRPLHLVS